jgi:hypothetical protein
MGENFHEEMRVFAQRIASGELPPRSGGYSGINSFAASSPEFNAVMNELVIQIREMNGRILLQEPFRVMWSVDTGAAVDTVFTACIRSHFPNRFHVYFDLVGGISRNYLRLMLPTITALIANGTFRMNNGPFNEAEWRRESIERITSIRQRDLERLEEDDQ